jgi:peroxiredoxin
LVGSALILPGAALGQFAEEGEFPPLFALPDELGSVHRLEDLRGTPTILYFTHNMCHYCTQIIGFLKRVRPLYDDSELVILTLNVWADGPKMIERYKEQFGLPFPMLAGKDRQLLRDYEVNYVPIVIFIGRDGRIRRIFHHYILAADFTSSVREIAGEGSG